MDGVGVGELRGLGVFIGELVGGKTVGVVGDWGYWAECRGFG